jgi:hypothetical protein
VGLPVGGTKLCASGAVVRFDGGKRGRADPRHPPKGRRVAVTQAIQQGGKERFGNEFPLIGLRKEGT